MKKQLLLFSAVLLIQASVVSMFAQSKPKAGDKISGIVSDDVAPMWKVKVAEKDSSGKTVRKKVTNKNGEFSFRLVNPEDRIQVTYEMYDTVNLPIDKTYFDIKIKIQDEVLCPSQYIDGPYSGFEGMGRVNLEYVDLGLSVKWAGCNVGADAPEDIGARIAWGETTVKTYYSRINYKNMKAYPSENRWWYSKYADKIDQWDGASFMDGKTRLEPEDDAAHVNWGGSWRMPTKEEYAELFEKCELTETTRNGVKGYLITSKVPGYTSNSIFLPYTDSSSAIYMTSDLSSRRVNSCVTLRFSQYETGTSDDEVNLGIGWADHGGLLEGIRWAKIHIEPYLRFSGAFIRAVTK